VTITAEQVLDELRYWVDWDEYRNRVYRFSESDSKVIRKKIDDLKSLVKYQPPATNTKEGAD
jgi:hypothetical protein